MALTRGSRPVGPSLQGIAAADGAPASTVAVIVRIHQSGQHEQALAGSGILCATRGHCLSDTGAKLLPGAASSRPTMICPDVLRCIDASF